MEHKDTKVATSAALFDTVSFINDPQRADLHRMRPLGMHGLVVSVAAVTSAIVRSVGLAD